MIRALADQYTCSEEDWSKKKIKKIDQFIKNLQAGSKKDQGHKILRQE